jgi:hypothetical protein
MSIGIGIAIYSALVAFISSLMVYYYRVMYPKEENQLREKSK